MDVQTAYKKKSRLKTDESMEMKMGFIMRVCRDEFVKYWSAGKAWPFGGGRSLVAPWMDLVTLFHVAGGLLTIVTFLLLIIAYNYCL